MALMPEAGAGGKARLAGGGTATHGIRRKEAGADYRKFTLEKSHRKYGWNNTLDFSVSPFA
jgi:hypothetical protein